MGTISAPAARDPRAATIHSWMFGAHMATRSPGSTPPATTARAARCTRSPSWSNDSLTSPSTTASRGPNCSTEARTIAGMLAQVAMVATRLPEGADGIPADLLVGRHQRESLLQRLCDQNPVEGIPVESRQVDELQSVGQVHRQDDEFVLTQKPGDEGSGGLGQVKAASALLHDDLPPARDAEVHVVAARSDCAAGSGGQPRISSGPPYERVGLEEESLSKYFSNSGSG